MEYRGRALYCEDISLAEIAARAGTPCYVYSSAAVLENFRAYDDSFGDVPHTVCYAVKANGNLALLRLLANAGAGFDIVSGGELYRVKKAAGDHGHGRVFGRRQNGRRDRRSAGSANLRVQLRIRTGTRVGGCACTSPRREGARRGARESRRGRDYSRLHLDR